MQVLNNRVMVKVLKQEQKGTIILPDGCENANTGIVVGVGNGKLLDNGTRALMQCNQDDIVVFSSYAGTVIEINNNEYKFLLEDELLAIL